MCKFECASTGEYTETKNNEDSIFAINQLTLVQMFYDQNDGE
jgi:hypothetical protein